MECQDFDRITALKIRHICCDAYKEKLQKKLLKHEGVYSVEMNPEKNLVLVRGRVDPDSLVNIVARTGKHAEIVFCKKKASQSKSKCCNSSSHKNCRHSCCQDHNKNNKGEEQHKCEDYVPPSIDEGMCRDYNFNRSPHSWSWRPVFHPNAAAFFASYGGGPFSHYPRRFSPAPPPAGYGFRRGRPCPGFYHYGY